MFTRVIGAMIGFNEDRANVLLVDDGGRLVRPGPGADPRPRRPSSRR